MGMKIFIAYLIYTFFHHFIPIQPFISLMLTEKGFSSQEYQQKIIPWFLFTSLLMGILNPFIVTIINYRICLFFNSFIEIIRFSTFKFIKRRNLILCCIAESLCGFSSSLFYLSNKILVNNIINKLEKKSKINQIRPISIYYATRKISSVLSAALGQEFLNLTESTSISLDFSILMFLFIPFLIILMPSIKNDLKIEPKYFISAI